LDFSNKAAFPFPLYHTRYFPHTREKG